MSRYYNQSVNKYVRGEPRDHILAKYTIAAIGAIHDYDFTVEVKTATAEGYTIDIELWDKQDIRDRVAVNIDGGYHFANWRQTKKTKNRDRVLRDYFKWLGIRYAVLKVDEVRIENIPIIVRKLRIKNKSV